MSADLIFLHGGFFPRCTARLDKYFPDYYTLQYSDGGAVELSFDDNAKVLHGQWFWTAYPGPKVAFRPAQGHESWEHRYIAFAGPRVAQWRGEGIYPHGPVQVSAGQGFAKRFDALLTTVKRGDRVGRLRAVNLLEGILIDLTDAQSPPTGATGQRWLSDAIQSLEQHVDTPASASEPPDYAALAARTAMGLSTFRRRFKQSTGMAPHVYLMHARVSRAREMLGSSEVPIKAIAERLGYHDVFFFSRQFKKISGVTPGAFRRSRQL